MKKSAGLLIIYKKEILLVHPTKNPWKGMHGIPKGSIEDGETKLDCAIRETYEEVGLLFKKEDIDPTEYCIKYKSKKNKAYKKVFYFIVNIDEKPEITKDQLQLEEVDWAGFLNYEEASEVIFPKQKDVLFHILSNNEKFKMLGWTVDCELPFEVSNDNGSLATGFAAEIVYDHLIENFEDYI